MPTEQIPPRWFIADTIGPIPWDVASYDERGRLHVPQRLLRGLSWFASSGPAEALAILEEPGRVRLVDPALKKAVLERHQSLVSLGEIHSPVLLETSFVRVHFESPARFTVPPPISLHLAMPPGAQVYALRFATELELWTLEYRVSLQRRAQLVFEGLP